MNKNEKIARELLGLAREFVAQRRKDKDIPHLPKGGDKSKLRDDRRKPHGLDKSDPDSKDTKRDPDLKTASRKMVARELVRIARVLVAYANLTKKCELKDDELTLTYDGSVGFSDMLQFYDNAATISENVTNDLKKVGVERIPDRFNDAFVLTEDTMSLKYSVPEGTDMKKLAEVLKKDGFDVSKIKVDSGMIDSIKNFFSRNPRNRLTKRS